MNDKENYQGYAIFEVLFYKKKNTLFGFPIYICGLI